MEVLQTENGEVTGALETRKLAPISINVRLTAIRQLAVADNGAPGAGPRGRFCAP